jgi:hypothetical protein
MAKHLPMFGALVIGVVVLVTYFPALSIGFWYDDYNHLELAGRPTLSEFIQNIFDPRVPRLWYRPIQQIQWRIEYMLWRGDALPYHLVQNIYHLVSVLSLYVVLTRLSKNWRWGFISALLYGVLPTYTLSVFWLGVPDPLVSSFYLLTMWLWIDFLEKGGSLRFALTYGTFVACFLTKEMAVFLPIILALIDRWIVAHSTSWLGWIKRNLLFFVSAPVALLLGWNGAALRLSGVSTGQANWNQLIANLMYYLAGLSFPWLDDSPIKYVIMGGLILLFAYAILTQRFAIPLLGIFGILTLIPNLNFVGVSNRHLYLPLMASAAGLGLVFQVAWNWLGTRVRDPRKFVLRAPVLLALGVLIVWQSWTVSESAVNFSGVARQARLPFRQIFQRHATFEPDTLLYFVEPPFSSYNVSGLMFLRYGANVSVRANDYEAYANLRESERAYVFYQNEGNEWQEIQVDPWVTAYSSPNVPVQFESGIMLEGYEVVETQVSINQALVLLLYWRATSAIDRDYTIFAHLVDEQGTLLAGYDNQPRRGAAPTSSWKLNALNVDPIILPIGPEIPLGRNYRVEVGLYYLPTMERLKISRSNQLAERDTVAFHSFTIAP